IAISATPSARIDAFGTLSPTALRALRATDGERIFATPATTNSAQAVPNHGNSNTAQSATIAPGKWLKPSGRPRRLELLGKRLKCTLDVGAPHIQMRDRAHVARVDHLQLDPVGEPLDEPRGVVDPEDHDVRLDPVGVEPDAGKLRQPLGERPRV